MPKLKLKKKKEAKQKKTEDIVRITNQNLEEQREEVISQGKKFKYPFQYTKHSLVITAIIVGVVGFILFSVFGWHQLYRDQNTGDVAYRFTRAIPLAVARVDGIRVRYSDYLAFYRSSVLATEQQQGSLEDTEDGRELIKEYKRQALSMVESCTYAQRKAEEQGISVSDEEIQSVEADHRGDRSEKNFREIVSANFGLSLREYRDMIKLSLYKKKYSEKIDAAAKKTAQQALEALQQNNGDFAAVAQALGNKVLYDESAVSLDSMNLDGGRAAQAQKLEVGQISSVFVSKNGDGYYIISPTKKTKSEIGYKSIWVRFTELEKVIEKLRKDGKIQEFIKVEEQ